MTKEKILQNLKILRSLKETQERALNNTERKIDLLCRGNFNVCFGDLLGKFFRKENDDYATICGLNQGRLQMFIFKTFAWSGERQIRIEWIERDGTWLEDFKYKEITRQEFCDAYYSALRPANLMIDQEKG